MRVHQVDPSAFTPPYDRALSAALARAGADVELWTSRFAYGPVPPAEGVTVHESFYRWAPGAAGSRTRQTAKLAQHVPDMLRYRRAALAADVVHFQWLTVQPLDVRLLPRARPLVITAHDVLPREPWPGQHAAQRRLYGRADAVVVHSEHGRARLSRELGLPAGRVHTIPHGAFTHLRGVTGALPPELAETTRPVVLFFGLIRPYKGLDVLLAAWEGLEAQADLWVVGMPRMPLPTVPAGVRVVARFVSDAEAAAVFARADLVVLPYLQIDQSGVLYTGLGLGKPLLLSDVGGFGEVQAAAHFAPGDPGALRAALARLLGDPAERGRLAAAARAAADGEYAWDRIAARHLELYRGLL